LSLSSRNCSKVWWDMIRWRRVIMAKWSEMMIVMSEMKTSWHGWLSLLFGPTNENQFFIEKHFWGLKYRSNRNIYFHKN
jgi:hypothetical protein